MGFFHIPEDILMKMTKKQLVEDLVKMGHPKGKERRDDLHIRLRNNLATGIVVIPPTQQQEANKNSSSRRCVVNKMEGLYLGAY